MSLEFLKLVDNGHVWFFLPVIKLSCLGCSEDNKNNAQSQSKVYSVNYLKTWRDCRALFYGKKNYKPAGRNFAI